MRIALDTNVLVSAVATRGLCADIFNFVLVQHQLIVGVTVLAELQRVLQDKMHVPDKAVRELDGLLRREAIIVVEHANTLDIAIRDETDLPVLAEAIAGGAEVLVTGDRDLLEITDILPIRILSPRGLWEELRNNAAPRH